MTAAGRSRTIGVVAASVAVHAVLLTLVALHAPRLRVPPPVSGPPIPVIPVLIVPRVPPPAATPNAKPTEIRLHRRRQRFADEDLPVAPLIAPTIEARRPAPTEGPKSVAPTPAQDALATNARNALRGRVGCANASAVGLSRAEREACEDLLAKGAKEAPFAGLGLERGKASDLGRTATQRERDFTYKRSAGPPGTTGAGPSANGNAVGRGNNLPGSTAEGIGAMVGSDKPTAKVPF